MESELHAAGLECDVYEDLESLSRVVREGTTPPGVVLARLEGAATHDELDGGLAAGVGACVSKVLGFVQGWLADPLLADTCLGIVGSGVVAVGVDELVSDLGGASAWGLLRSAQSEHPGRFVLLDVDGASASWEALMTAVRCGEPQVAVREGALFAPRLAPASSSGALNAPQGVARWRLAADRSGTLEGLDLVEYPEAERALGESEIRVAMRAAGLNFRDVLVALGMVRLDDMSMGGEGAGVVLEVGAGVEDLQVGDRVMGLIPGAMGQVAVDDHRGLVRMPQGWSFVQAASVPVVFLTAYYGLVDLAALRKGDRVLIHAATGGVGMAAVQLARHLGAEVFVTASPGKWEALREMGFAEERIASSRTPEFREKFLEVTGGQGMDIVLNCLANELADASLELLPGGGRFIEMGKTDIRDPGEVAARYAGVRYQAFDLAEAGPERIQEMLGETLELFERGVLSLLPVRCWDVRRAREAFRFMGQARHVGKNVITLPVSTAQWDGTALVTGGTSGLGVLLARHLVLEHGMRSLLLVSRRGTRTPGAQELVRELEGLGAEVRICACDVADREQLRALLMEVPREHPLSVVVHAAAALDDGVMEALSDERLQRVMAPKVAGAWHLHELTREMDLRAFVLFSSAAATFGNPGQANYAAANAFLDALAPYRRGQGLPAVSMAWGYWAQATELTATFAKSDRAWMAREGVSGLSAEEGLELFDQACELEEPLVLPIPLDTAAIRAWAGTEELPAILRGLADRPSRGRGARRPKRGKEHLLAQRLVTVRKGDRERVVLELVCAEAATVLGHSSSKTIDPESAFKDIGFDSLTAVELRNRLGKLSGLKLPATLVFDYPNPLAVARYLLEKIEGTEVRLAPAARTAAALDEPIAIVGMSCRYPGGAHSPEELWRLVSPGTDAIAPFPDDRGWDLDRIYDPDFKDSDTSYASEGGFIYDLPDFDAEFFGIRPYEALAMDPQQRLLLENSWEALENASISPLSQKGSLTGVYVGVSASGYGIGAASQEMLEGYRLTGGLGSVVSGRVAYALGLEGPAVSVDTACSSSLVALHLACGALRSGECSLALAGGVGVLVSPEGFVEFARLNGLARDGRCKAYSDAADGTGWGEGAGVVVLERLSDAQRNGRRVLAVVRGSAINQDGASNGLAAPNGPSQQRVILQALANAGLSSVDVDVVEGHGTGTVLGDPIEAQALLATYGQGRDRPLWLGSVKSNLGHTQAAAGVAGVIKMVKALEHGVLPRTLHVDAPSRHVDWESGRVSLLVREVPWEANGKSRCAGVSSFGISGTNAHLILEEAPPAESPAVLGSDVAAGDGVCAGVLGVGGVVPWVLSGKGEASLRGQADRLHGFVKDRAELDVLDVGFSLSERAVFGDRAVVLGGDREELLAGLRALGAGEPSGGVVLGRAGGGRGGVFVFPGQGAQWEGMAVELLDNSPVFAEQMSQCEVALSELVDWSLVDVLRGESGGPGLDRVDVVQPALWAIMVSLAGLWRACGVSPVAVVGHSQGEIAAACVAGGLSFEDGARVVVSRSRALVSLAGLGGMVSIAASIDGVEERLERWGGRIGVAAVNGPSTVVVSGDTEALDELLVELGERGVWARRIPVDYAAHSQYVEGVREELLEGCAGIEPQTGGMPFYSAVTGGLLDMAGLDGEYWYRNLRETVQFERAMRAALVVNGASTAVEISPHPVLTASVEEVAEELSGGTSVDVGTDAGVGVGAGGVLVVGSLRRGEGGLARFLRSASEIWIHGTEVDWGKVLEGSGAVRVGLPTYAFQRERYWLNVARGTGDAAALGQASAEHPLLSAAVPRAEDRGVIFTGSLSPESHPWLADHAVMGTIILPGTAFVELALHVGRKVDCGVVSELTLEVPLVLSDEHVVQVQITVGDPDDSGERSIGIYSRPENPADTYSEESWTRHAGGVLTPPRSNLNGQPGGDEHATWLGGEAWPPEGAQVMEVENIYHRLGERGYEYGPVLQGVRAAWQRGDEVFAEVSLPEDQRPEASRFCVHPALLDASLHPLLLSVAKGERPMLPFVWKDVRLLTTGAESLRARFLFSPDDRSITFEVADDRGGASICEGQVIGREISSEQLSIAAGTDRHILLHRDWRAISEVASVGRCAVLDWQEGCLRELLQSAPSASLAYTDLDHLTEAVNAGEPLPDSVLADFSHGMREAGEWGDMAVAVRYVLNRALALMQRWLADDRWLSSRLIFVTKGTVATHGKEDVPDLISAPLCGLVRSAQSEHPGRFGFLDIDETAASIKALGSAVELGETQLALRDGKILAPRLTRVNYRGHDEKSLLDCDGTVLITGGTGGLGGLLARHLVVAHGVQHLVLVSRRGRSVDGASVLEKELRDLGTDVEIVACDVSDRDQLKALIDSVSERHQLSAVIHTAATFANSMVDSLTPELLDHVLAPKLDAAIHLDELTQNLDLRAFVLFSSIASIFGGPGQANYAAANAFLDALAEQRRARGLPATSMAWSLWKEVGVGRELADIAVQRVAGSASVGSFTPEEGLKLFDTALASGEPMVIPTRIDTRVLRAESRAGALPPLLSAIVRAPVRVTADVHRSFVQRLMSVSTGDRERAALEETCTHVALVLGHSSASMVDAERQFLELGFDSMMAVELRNRLSSATGLRLPATIVFDNLTPAALASYLLMGLNLAEKQDSERSVEHLDQDEHMGRGAPASDVSNETFGSMFKRAHDLGRMEEFVELLIRASRFRQAFDAPLRNEETPKAVRLSEGPADPGMICFPSFIATSGAHQYARFAKVFRGAHNISVLPLPGFHDGERIPATFGVLVDTLADAVLRHADDTPFVLGGHSTGGLLAYAVAVKLESLGTASPSAVVLIDTYIGPSLLTVTPWIFDGMIDNQLLNSMLRDTGLTAMIAYGQLVSAWEISRLTAPVLLVRARQPLTSASREGTSQRPSLDVPHIVIDTEGNHFTIMEDHAASTAQVVKDWLDLSMTLEKE